jgi:hypothetical protein
MRVKSSAIRTINYHEGSHTLSITFKNSGRTYEYYDVSKRTFNRLMDAESKGAFVNKWITPRYRYLPIE